MKIADLPKAGEDPYIPDISCELAREALLELSTKSARESKMDPQILFDAIWHPGFCPDCLEWFLETLPKYRQGLESD